ncbi:MAG: DUF512 domain-containing protein, partial [Oscillospiraceae bacterium]|nr:DUF512 domain-containing protein [Oscillospiraceae bacterium]
MGLIKSVEPGSPADRAGLMAGETLAFVNGHEILDVLDYRFYTYDPRLKIVLSGKGGRTRRITIRKGEGEDLGLEFETYLMDSHRRCQNRCVFCFIDQMPRGCRESLYFKDDDARLSFLLGNYITLTNLEKRDIRRITEMRVSPLHVSVHTTNPELRVKMMGNPSAGRCLELLRFFAKARIALHTQIVLCPGLNDGSELRRTLDDLDALGESVESTSVVPVGLTSHRAGLTPLESVTPQGARAAIELCGEYKRVYCADEMYLLAGLPIPKPEDYDGYPQLENGVGMLALFKERWDGADKPQTLPQQTLVTGVAAAPFLRELLAGLPVDVIAAENSFFGKTVTVAGLLTGR